MGNNTLSTSYMLEYYERSNFFLETDLYKIIENNHVGDKVTVADDLLGVAVVKDNVTGKDVLLAKDLGKYQDPDVIQPGQANYMTQPNILTGDFQGNYDQSNWVALTYDNGAFTADCIGHILKGGSVSGTYTDELNPAIAIEGLPAIGSAQSYTPNVYIPASFKGTQTSPINNLTYFFVQPKPQEYAKLQWAVWDGDKFITVPYNAELHNNIANLSGEAEMNDAYLENLSDQQNLKLNYDKTGDNIYNIYDMDVVVKKLVPGYEEFPDLYVIGNVNGNTFSPDKGVKMYTADGVNYYATICVDPVETDAGGSFGYFTFSKKLASSWDELNSDETKPRIGPVSDGDFYMEYDAPSYQSNWYGKEIQMTDNWYDGTKSFRARAGYCTLAFRFSDYKMVITRYTSPTSAPRRANGDSGSGYAVYPLSISLPESVITGVERVGAKAVASVEYVNLAGMRSAMPWPGLNIVVTNYADGTRTTGKVLR